MQALISVEGLEREVLVGRQNRANGVYKPKRKGPCQRDLPWTRRNARKKGKRDVKRNEVNDTTPDRPEREEVATISLFRYMLSLVTNSDVTVNKKEREGEVRVREEKKGCQGRKKIEVKESKKRNYRDDMKVLSCESEDVQQPRRKVAPNLPSPTPGSLHFHFLCKAITEAHQPLFNPTNHLLPPAVPGRLSVLEQIAMKGHSKQVDKSTFSSIISPPDNIDEVVGLVGSIKENFNRLISCYAPWIKHRCEQILSLNSSLIFSIVLAAFSHMGLFPTAVMSHCASSTVLSFLGLRKIRRIDKDWYHPFCLVNGVDIGYGQSPITRIGIREPSRCV
ncbi:unnamed protein product [Sphenostylis stenocarpa]|uniref:Uncharacterized protein n=1 Tax=Sphenostylis stenocarpa TaxID=92480 RepID=A0AA86W456_9FABA|nr:unnamed protein product [Sphenostylis stenocarpa]